MRHRYSVFSVHTPKAWSNRESTTVAPNERVFHMSVANCYRIEPGGDCAGTFVVPGDKSICHRALMLGAIADGATEIRWVSWQATIALLPLDALQRHGHCD